MRKTSLFILLLLFTAMGLHSQSSALSPEMLAEKLQLYAKSKPDHLLFLHLDKAVYTNNETIWLSAYLVKSATDLGRHSILSTALVKDDTREIYLQKKFNLENGYGYGNIALPDSIAPGNYHLIAYTNLLDKNNEPIALFTQPVTIKSITNNSFTASLSLIDSTPINGQMRARLAITLPETKPKEKPEVTYTIGNNAVKKLSLDKLYNGIINISSDDIRSNAAASLLVTVNYNNEKQFLSILIPQNNTNGIKMRFFPEGGSLVRGVSSIVACESMTISDQPVSVKGILYKNDQPVDTIVTSSYGIGKFNLLPDINARYSLHVESTGSLQKDTVFHLPVILPDGVVIKLEEAVLNDTLNLNLFASQNKTVNVLIHNYREGFAFFEMSASPKGSRAAIALPAVPKGIAAITILDELGRPLAERLFFAHYQNEIKTVITTDKSKYAPKEKVTVQLKLSDDAGEPIRGLVSIACIQSNRLENHNRQDIESYTFLKNDLSPLPISPGRGFENKNYITQVAIYVILSKV